MHSNESSSSRSDTAPLVSIGMPVYNGEEYIEEAVKSLLRQSFLDTEIIISDNASTDGTVDICKRLANEDRRIRLICQNENSGVIANFAHVLDRARGTYFMWAAADDIWSPDWLAVLVAEARKQPCVAFGLVETIDESGRNIPQLSDNRPVQFTGNTVLRRLRYFLSPSLLGKQNSYYGLYPRDVISSGMLYDLADTAQALDVFFMYEVLRTIEIRHAGPAVMYKRKHGKSDGAARGSILKSRTIVDRLFKRSLIHKYLKYSNFSEKLLLLAAFPVCVFRIRLAKLKYLVFRLVRAK